MIITLDGERIRVALDGKSISSFDAGSPDVPARKAWSEPIREIKQRTHGYIGLQNHDPGDVVWFREVSVRPLRAAKYGEAGVVVQSDTKPGPPKSP